MNLATIKIERFSGSVAMKLALFVAALMLALALACGGGDDDEATAVSTVAPTATAAVEIATLAEPTSTPTAEAPTETATPQAAAIAATVAATATARPEATATTAPAPTSAPTAAPATATSIPPTATSVPPTATSVPPTPAPPASSESLVRAIAIVLGAQEFGVPSSDVSVDSSESVTWASDALGCVVPGEIYASGSVEGWRFTVSAGSSSLEYHADATGDSIITCAEAERVSSLPSVNVVDSAGLSGVTRIAVIAASAGIEVVSVDDQDRIDLVLAALSDPTYLDTGTSCDSLFEIEFVTGSGSVTLEYACSGESQVLRGAQSFWGSSDGISPAGFQLIINEALAAREFPGFPPTP